MYRCSIYSSYRVLPVKVPNGPVNDLVRTRATVDSKDVFWLATDEGLLKGTTDADAFRLEKRYTEENGLRSQRVFAVAEGPDGSIWVCYPGSSAGVTRLKGQSVTHYDEDDGLASPEVWSMASMG